MIKHEIRPRPYQEEALQGIHEQLEKANSTLLVLATGLGKTITFSQLADHYRHNGRVMVLGHREELIFQAQEKIEMVTGCEPDIEMGQYHVQEEYGMPSPIIVSTIQTQISGRAGAGRMAKFDPDDFSLLVIDEAHHSAAKSYRRVIDYYRSNPHLKVLGVTATPDRADELALGQIFETVAFEYGIREGVLDGWLVPIVQRFVNVEGLDYSNIRTTAGDLNGRDLAGVLEFEETLHRFASPIIELAGERKTLIFAASLVHAERLTEILNRHKPQSAEWVHGGTPKDIRRILFRRYADKRFQFLVNVGVATEGFDDPSIEIVAMARPTKSRSLYAQMAGRGTRPLPGIVDDLNGSEARLLAIRASEKPNLEILDFVGNSGRHKLITTADILGGIYSDENEFIAGKEFENVVERATRMAQESGEPVDMIQQLEWAQKQLERDKEQQASILKRKRVTLRAKYSTAQVNPFDILDVEPDRVKPWHDGRRATEKQVELLKRWGVDAAGLQFTHASQIIGRMIKNREKGLCTYKQARLLRKFDYETKDIKFEQAGEMIDALAKNQWRKPA